MSDLSRSLAENTPPEDLSPAAQALWWIAKGDYRTGPEWEQAHGIAQTHEGTPFLDAIHALLHRIEGDASNAAYWDRRAGSAPDPAGVTAEWERLARDLPKP